MLATTRPVIQRSLAQREQEPTVNLSVSKLDIPFSLATTEDINRSAETMVKFVPELSKAEAEACLTLFRVSSTIESHEAKSIRLVGINSATIVCYVPEWDRNIDIHYLPIIIRKKRLAQAA